MISPRGGIVSVGGLLGLAAGPVLAVVIETVPVGNPGNAGDSRFLSNYGAVGHTYNIGRYEVTAAQYTEFLNAVARTDTYGLYNTFMDADAYPWYAGCNISRSGVSGSYTYSVAPDWANRPVNFVSWGDAARFVNWLHNGQPTGAQDLSTTEDGAYYLNGATSDVDLMAVTRKPGWKWAIPTENEWYKAAYHKNDGVTGNYWDYPTGSNVAPGRDLPDLYGNNANYYGTPYPIQPPFYTTAAGTFANSASPYGTFDQGGNVWEWNETAFNNRYRGLRGGAFSNGTADLRASDGVSTYPSFQEPSYGFRVVEVPEPASLCPGSA